MANEYDLKMLKEAVELSKSCSVSGKAYSVGAIITDADNNISNCSIIRER